MCRNIYFFWLNVALCKFGNKLYMRSSMLQGVFKFLIIIWLQFNNNKKKKCN